jgi:hypothetical protein
MQQLIQQYLLKNHALPIYGLGRLRLHKIPSSYSATEQAFVAPIVEVVFEPNHNVDIAPFVGFLSESNNSDEASANQWCKRLSEKISSLPEGEKLNIAHAGSFTKGSEGVSFTSFSLSNVFHPSIPVKRVVHPNDKHTVVVGDNEVSNEYMNVLLNNTPSSKQIHWLIPAVCLMMIAISITLLYFFREGNFGLFGNSNSIEINIEPDTYQIIK